MSKRKPGHLSPSARAREPKPPPPYRPEGPTLFISTPCVDDDHSDCTVRYTFNDRTFKCDCACHE